MKFNDNYSNRPKAKKEKLNPISKIEIVGYVPFNKQIAVMIASGAKLQMSRAEQYDSMDLSADIPIDPTRGKDFDLVDAHQYARDVTERLQEQARKAREDKQTPPPVPTSTPIPAPAPAG